jgi:hypothetical protein
MRYLFIVLMLALAQTGCKRRPISGASSSASAASPDKSSPAFAPVVISNSEEETEIKNIIAKSKANLQTKKFAELEADAETYRTGKEYFPDGLSKIGCFYSGFSSEEMTDAERTGNAKTIAEWIKQYPDSITARIALAELWIDYAWHARGHEYADQVADEAFKLFSQRIANAHAVLKAAAGLKSKCPMYWYFMEDIALSEGWSNKDYEALFLDAIKNNPGFSGYYKSRVIYLLPRWYGKEGDWEKFAESSADKIGGDDGDVLYARLVWTVKDLQIYNYIYEETKISWPRAKRGFEVLQKRFPQSLSVTSEY